MMRTAMMLSLCLLVCATGLALAGTTPYESATRVMTKKYSWMLDTKAMLAKSDFKIKPDDLIERCKEVIENKVGLANADDLADDFVFQFPVIGPLTKAEYLKSVSGFEIETMFGDINIAIHDFRVDPFLANRVWYTVAFTGTNDGPSPFGKPTGKRATCPPQVNSLTFNEQGKVIKYTGGYVVDKEIGNSGGMGGLFGPLYAIGRGFPFPEAKPYKRSWQFKFFSVLGNLVGKIQNFMAKFKGNSKTADVSK